MPASCGLAAKEIRKTVYPKVISASRATDIPAFHVPWLMERLAAGESEWQNPFNARHRQTVSFANVQAIVFWSKNPAPLIPYLPEIEDQGKKFYFQYTLNDYEAEGLESGRLPPLSERIAAFVSISRKYPVVWRYDPLILGDTLTVKAHLKKIEFLLNHLAGSAEKLVFSFVDLYRRAARELGAFNPLLRRPEPFEMRDFACGLAELRDKIAPRLPLAACAETTVELADLKIEKSRCIDPELINRICGKDVYPKKTDLPESVFAKDKGQRKACNCAPSKDIGSYRLFCGHGCVYCYGGHAANASKGG